MCLIIKKMKFDLRFITTLVLIVLIIISFVFLILETLYFSGNTTLTFVDNGTGAAKDISAAKIDDVVKVKAAGPGPSKIVADTQYYRYGSLLIHVLALISGAYIVYSG